MFPLWWSEEKAVECEALGMNGGWSFLSNVIEKSDLIEYYGISSMPMQLRMFAEQVYGRGPGGQSGTAAPFQSARHDYYVRACLTMSHLTL
jgi:splicing suppressor protein 51